MPQPRDIRLVGFPSAFNLEQRIERREAPGKTLAERVESIVPGWQNDDRVGIEVAVSGNRIERANWKRIRPKAGAQVLVLAGPADDRLRTFLQVVVTVAAIGKWTVLRYRHPWPPGPDTRRDVRERGGISQHREHRDGHFERPAVIGG